jgi:predicted RNA-binding Zn ribbon-like protein
MIGKEPKMGEQVIGELRDGMPFVGGRLWIDFVNSATATMGDFLETPDGWRRWIAAADLPPESTGEMPDVGPARDLRTALATLLAHLIRQTIPPEQAVDAVNRHLGAVAVRKQLQIRDGVLAIGAATMGGSDVLAAIAQDFADFAADFEPHRLRHCSGPDCTLAFYDTARNATRRWCSMALCGNRHKVKTHRARKLVCD